MKIFRRYFTYILSILLVLTFAILGLFRRDIFDQLVDLIKIIWPALIGLLAFGGLAVFGVLKQKPKSFDEAFDSIYLQLTVLLFFIFISGLLIHYWNNRVFKLYVSSDPPDSEIYIDNKFHSRTPDSISFDEPKVVVIEVKRSGYIADPVKLEIGKKQIQNLQIALQKVCTVTILSNRHNQYIEINGDSLPRETSSHERKLPSGVYKIIYGIHKSDYDTVNVEIRNDRKIIVPEDLK